VSDSPRAAELISARKYLAVLGEHSNRAHRIGRELDEFIDCISAANSSQGTLVPAAGKLVRRLSEHLSEYEALVADLDEWTGRLPRGDFYGKQDLLAGAAKLRHSTIGLAAKSALARNGLQVKFGKETFAWIDVKSSATSDPAPPNGACLLLDLLLAKADRQVVTGDMEEEFRAKSASYGPRGARLWFWGETVRNVATLNPVCRWVLVGGLMRVITWILRNISS
jgi:hypothetical protein